MASERRGDADIRADIAVEREQLVTALTELREDVSAKRKPVAIVGSAVVASVAFVILRGIARRLGT